MNEKQHQIRSANGEMAEVSKNQPALALKVSILSLAEKIIGFQDREFQAKAQNITATLVEHHNYLKGQSGDLVECLIKSKEFNQARDFFKSNMYWREGQYTFRVSLQEVRLRSHYSQCFALVFSKADVERLRANCDQIEPYVRALIASGEGVTEKLQWPLWN